MQHSTQSDNTWQSLPFVGFFLPNFKQAFHIRQTCFSYLQKKLTKRVHK